MVNVSDIRSMTAGNGLEKIKTGAARFVFPFGNLRQKKRLCHYFLEQL